MRALTSQTVTFVEPAIDEPDGPPANANAPNDLEIPPALVRALRQMVAHEVQRALATMPRATREGMNADDVAAFLGVDRKTVYDYANRGHIPHQRLGKRLLFSRTALVSWLGACKSASAERSK